MACYTLPCFLFVSAYIIVEARLGEPNATSKLVAACLHEQNGIVNKINATKVAAAEATPLLVPEAPLKQQKAIFGEALEAQMKALSHEDSEWSQAEKQSRSQQSSQQKERRTQPPGTKGGLFVPKGGTSRSGRQGDSKNRLAKIQKARGQKVEPKAARPLGDSSATRLLEQAREDAERQSINGFDGFVFSHRGHWSNAEIIPLGPTISRVVGPNNCTSNTCLPGYGCASQCTLRVGCIAFSLRMDKCNPQCGNACLCSLYKFTNFVKLATPVHRENSLAYLRKPMGFGAGKMKLEQARALENPMESLEVEMAKL